LTLEEIARQFGRLSRDSMAKGTLDQLGTEIFTTGKVRKALDRLFAETPSSFIRLIRKTMLDSSVAPKQIEQALHRIWDTGKEPAPQPRRETSAPRQKRKADKPVSAYSESHHIDGKPNEIVEL
jgi:hypothetical protein